MARSGSSFNKKLSPLKYEFGRERVSESICLMSTRAAIQPSANNRGTNISHHGSKSTYSASVQFTGEPVARRFPAPRNLEAHWMASFLCQVWQDRKSTRLNSSP